MNVELEEGFSKSLFEVIHTADDLRRIPAVSQCNTGNHKRIWPQ